MNILKVAYFISLTIALLIFSVIQVTALSAETRNVFAADRLEITRK